ncbi:A/G-specific adenine glycosylase [Alkalibacillus almallahensis]|uniref:A/G-specific adenine glycosylase n=1 Tax=Alkalibacillus almallahensis TaxID=1379154 RepID=UPI00142396AE|nr:A/G-specific adenine glycosylase [Alkalibacillus almallahensis]NIK11576.1 A/G-specific adenine glycosylase [Alkalibacillus almallahensis]
MSNKSSISIPVLFDGQAFRNDLINWYYDQKRDLPWRRTQDPYHIWVSEIMLQQTQVDTVIPYFKHFMNHYPTVYELAHADQQDVLKAWEGLGYYSRARNLHDAVKEVVSTYNGQVPSDKKELKKLKGVGSYTQGAILSIAFNQPEPAVDGNVMRVMSRVLEIDEDIAKPKTKTVFEDIIRDIISEEDPSAFNQGLMELGALICQPKNPRCDQCPVQSHCQAYAKGIQTELPVKTKAKKQKQETYFTLILRDNTGNYLIEKRPDDGLLAGLWQFPLYSQEKFTETSLINWFKEHYGVSITLTSHLGRVKHVFSHVIWEVDILEAEIIDQDRPNLNGEWVDDELIRTYPLPNVQQKVLNKLI